MCLSFRPKPLRVANRQPICLKARRGFLATAAPADLVKKVNLTHFDTRSRTTRARYESLPAHYLLTVPSLQSPARYLILLGCHYAATSALSMAQTLVACARKRRDLRPLLDDPQLDQALGWLKKRAAVYRAKGLERKAVHIPLIKMKDIIIATFKRSTTLGCYMLLTFVTASRRADLSAFHLQEIRPLKPPYQRYSSLLFQMSFWKSDRDGMHTCHKVAVIPTELVKLVQRMTKKWDPPSWDKLAASLPRPYTPHSIRHSAVHALEKNFSLEQISILTQHSAGQDRATISRYLGSYLNSSGGQEQTSMSLFLMKALETNGI